MKQFKPDFEYRFWFWKHKFFMILEMIALLIDYDFMDSEIIGMLLDLENTDNENPSKWSGELHYCKKDVVFMKFAQDLDNKDIIHCFIATHEVLKERIEFIDLMQEHYKWFQKLTKMSEVKDKFYEILVPKIEVDGFDYKKSKTSFVKIKNGLEYQINFRWDGRGGTTMMDSLDVCVSDLAIQKVIKKRTKRNGLPHVMSGWGYCATNNVKIPVMYSKAALDLANNMNFKALSQMAQDDKYPPERIINAVKFVEDLIIAQVFPFFDKFKNNVDIYNYLREKAENDPNSINFTDDVKAIFKEYAAKLGLPDIAQLSE